MQKTNTSDGMLPSRNYHITGLLIMTGHARSGQLNLVCANDYSVVCSHLSQKRKYRILDMQSQFLNMNVSTVSFSRFVIKCNWRLDRLAVIDGCTIGATLSRSDTDAYLCSHLLPHPSTKFELPQLILSIVGTFWAESVCLSPMCYSLEDGIHSCNCPPNLKSPGWPHQSQSHGQWHASYSIPNPVWGSQQPTNLLNCLVTNGIPEKTFNPSPSKISMHSCSTNNQISSWSWCL
jgi:hypothetical protein